MTNAWKERLGDFNPSYPAMVMATGIVSVAAHLAGLPRVATALLWLNVAYYLAIVSIDLARCVAFPRRVAADLADHNRGVGFFTVVAATCVLGSQLVLLLDARRAALALWVLGVALWAVLTYAIFAALTLKQSKPSLAEGIHGGWLLAVVAAQSVSVLGTLLAPSLPAGREEVLFFCLSLWLGGAMLYVWIITLIFYRYTFFPLDPPHLSPPYWVNMGSMAITTLAGVGLTAAAPHSALLSGLAPFLKGFTLLAWATATFWIPMLVILGVWRHVVARYPLKYDPSYWGAVFPLGMYSACTFRLAEVFRLPFLEFLPRCFLVLALGAWLLASFGLARSLWVGPPRDRTKPG